MRKKVTKIRSLESYETRGIDGSDVSNGWIDKWHCSRGGVLTKIPFTPGSYCHMKFESIQDRALSTDHPALKDSSDGDIIDFYGPCDESPTGADQVRQQELEKFHRAGY
jgi:hypothetical protein